MPWVGQGPLPLNQALGVTICGLPLLPPREERAGERRVVCSNRNPPSPTLSPFVPHGEREKTGFSLQQCLIQWHWGPGDGTCSIYATLGPLTRLGSRTRNQKWLSSTGISRRSRTICLPLGIITRPRTPDGEISPFTRACPFRRTLR